MVNIHALRDVHSIQHPVYGHILVDPDLRTINVSQDLADELLRIRVDGAPIWESEVDYDRRRAVAELERKRDPAQHALLLEKLIELQAKQAGIDLNAPLEAPKAPVIPAVEKPAPVDDSARVAASLAAQDYDVLGRNDLSKHAASIGLDGSGSKSDLIARLREKDRGRR